MKNKKLRTMLVSLALVAVVGVGATLAYLTAETGKLTNKFTFSNGIDMTLDEDEVNSDTHEIVTEDTIIAGENGEGNTYNNILPGEVLPKDPTVQIVPKSPDCYVFVGVKNPNADELTLNIDTAHWLEIEKVNDVTYYVYAENGQPVVVPESTRGQRLFPVFTTVTVGTDVETEGVNLEDIVVKASAVQSKVAGVDDYAAVKDEGLNLVKQGFGK